MTTPIINPENGRRTVRWLIAHYPVKLFIRAAKAFEQELEKLSPGKFEIEIHTGGSYFDKYSHLFSEEELKAIRVTTPTIKNLENSYRSVSQELPEVSTFNDIKKRWKAHFLALRAGKFEMTQTQVNIVGSHLYKNLHAIDLPFLFKDHDHVSRTLDGVIGDRLCEEMSKATGVRGLGFTYSGGYRIVGSTDEVTSLSELGEKKFLTFTAPSNKFFSAAGVKHISRSTATINDIADMNEEGGAIETTYLRFEGKNVLKTNHSMFMTTILTGNKFFGSLSAEDQEAFRVAAKRVAKLERLWSVEDAQKYEDEAVSRGVKIIDLSDADRQALKNASEEVYTADALEQIGVDAKLVEEIINLGK